MSEIKTAAEPRSFANFVKLFCSKLILSRVFSMAVFRSSTKSIRRVLPTKKITSINKKSLNHKIVFTNGCFDMLHKGHYKLLKFAKSLGNKLIVGLNSDNSVKKLKGSNRPINNIKKRIKNLLDIPYVDEIVVFNEKTPLNIIKKIKPNIIVKGGDYAKKKIAGSKISKIKIFPLIKGLSTTKIINNKKKFI